MSDRWISTTESTRQDIVQLRASVDLSYDCESCGIETIYSGAWQGTSLDEMMENLSEKMDNHGWGMATDDEGDTYPVCGNCLAKIQEGLE